MGQCMYRVQEQRSLQRFRLTPKNKSKNKHHCVMRASGKEGKRERKRKQKRKFTSPAAPAADAVLKNAHAYMQPVQRR